MVMNKIYSFLLLALLTLNAMAEPLLVNSPDGNLTLAFDLLNGKPNYALSYKKKAIIETSTLGFKIKQSPDFGSKFILEKNEARAFTENWTPVWGEVKTIKNNYNELIVTLRDNAEKSHVIQIVF
jgi:hypothetical protein